VSNEEILEKLRKHLEEAVSRLGSSFIRSAVMVLLLDRGDDLEIVLELRADHLRRSPGEVGFPGGRLEPGESPWEAALRELHEELGVTADRIELLGTLPEQQRRRHELIVPFVCSLDPGVQLAPRDEEVEEVFTLPLSRLQRDGFEEASIVEQYFLSEDFPKQYLFGGEWRQRLIRPVYYYKYGKYFVWGLTARILLQLLELLRLS